MSSFSRAKPDLVPYLMHGPWLLALLLVLIHTLGFWKSNTEMKSLILFRPIKDGPGPRRWSCDVVYNENTEIVAQLPMTLPFHIF